MNQSLAQPEVATRNDSRTYDRFMRQCSYDLDGLREPMGARPPRTRAVGPLMRTVGLPRIPPEDLARIAVPTTPTWGRHDRATRLPRAEQASARDGSPLYVVDDCADDPPHDRPEAFLEALRLAFGTTSAPGGSS